MRVELVREIYNTSYLRGQFHLRSGSISNEYFDKYLFESEPHLLNEIAKGMSQLIPDETEVIAGLEMGGIPIVTALSLITNKKASFVRKKAKELCVIQRNEEASEILAKENLELKPLFTMEYIETLI